MKPVLKIALYLVLVASAVVFGRRCLTIYYQRTERAALRLEQPESTNAASAAPLRQTAGSTAGSSYLGVYGFLTFGVVVAFGFLFGHDVSQYLAQRATQELFNDEGEGIADPEYDKAEQVWADGDHLEAIRLMREFLKKNPRAQHAALRIAEIYEKDLNNPLAAALEYEEVLTKKLEPERWGWSAIHLCNLYYRMDQQAKADALLHRIVREYGQTAAAKKARERLGLPEEGAEEGLSEAAPEAAADGSTTPGKLPPGFRLKKG